MGHLPPAVLPRQGGTPSRLHQIPSISHRKSGQLPRRKPKTVPPCAGSQLPRDQSVIPMVSRKQDQDARKERILVRQPVLPMLALSRANARSLPLAQSIGSLPPG